VPSDSPSVAKSGGSLKNWPFLAPVIALMLVWMIVPLAMTLWFSFQNYNLLDPTQAGFAGLDNYAAFLSGPAMLLAVVNTLLLVGGVLLATVVFGTLFALVLDQEFFGRNVARLLAIAPFFVMPAVAALVWKNLMMHPVNGLLAWVAESIGMTPIDWFTAMPLGSIAIIVAWQWIPFATLILLTALQSLDREQVEAARMDGARGLQIFRYVIWPHLQRPISVLVMIEALFLLAIFAEIHITTSGGPGQASTTLTYLVFQKALVDWDVGGASAAGVIAIILANVLAFFLVRTIARNLKN
jgi:sorbitol/mannitol transport system permease protein